MLEAWVVDVFGLFLGSGLLIMGGVAALIFGCVSSLWAGEAVFSRLQRAKDLRQARWMHEDALAAVDRKGELEIAQDVRRELGR